MEDFKLIQYLKKQLDDAEMQKVGSWINASSQNRTYYAKLVKSWEMAGRIPELENPDLNKAWHKLEPSLRERRKIITLSAFLRIAAAAAILIISIFIVYRHTNIFSIQNLVTIASGDSVKTVVLPIIGLNKNSSISWSKGFGRKTREVHMTGEAFFKVSKNKEVPFVIKAAFAEVNVIGTSFNIGIDSAETIIKIALITGKIRFTENEKSGSIYSLIPNQIAVLEKDSTPRIYNSSTINDNAWFTHKLTFRKQTIKEIATVLESYFHIYIAIKNPALDKKRITADFKGQNLEEVLKVLQHTIDFQFSITKDSVIIK